MTTLYLLFGDNYQLLLSSHHLEVEHALHLFPDTFINKHIFSTQVPDEFILDNKLHSHNVFNPNSFNLKDIALWNKVSPMTIDFQQKKLQYWYSNTSFTKIREFLKYGIWLITYNHCDNPELIKHRYFFSEYKANDFAHTIICSSTYNFISNLFLSLPLEDMVKIYAYYEWKIIENLS
jgi:hypothetical protein